MGNSFGKDIYLNSQYGSGTSSKIGGSGQRNGPVVAVTVFLFVVLGLVGLSMYLLKDKEVITDNTVAISTCIYEGTTYQEGQSFKSKDECNTCSCSGGQVSCTEMSCEPEITETPEPTELLISPTVSVSLTPTVSSIAANTMQVYFAKPAGATDYTTLEAVARPTDLTGSALYSFVITQIINGPTTEEKTSGITGVLKLSGSSTCGGSAYQYSRTGSILSVRFCKQLGYIINSGSGDSYAGLGLAANARIFKALEASLKINGVTKLIVKDANNNCFAQDAGVNLDCTP